MYKTLRDVTGLPTSVYNCCSNGASLNPYPVKNSAFQDPPPKSKLEAADDKYVCVDRTECLCSMQVNIISSEDMQRCEKRYLLNLQVRRS